jgi:hypothetical protein
MFLIERVEVRNAQRFDARLLAAETLLHEGEAVTEEEVRDGVRRLTRLPFVFAADYVLEPGTESVKRVVVITVRENHRYWFLVDGRFAQVYEPVDALDYDFPDRTAEWKDAAAGVRWLFFDGGVAHFGMTVLRNRHPFGKNYSAYELGYTRHRILGTRLFATVILRSPVDSLEEKTFTPDAIVGMPLTANQTVQVEYEDSSFRNDTFRIGSTDFRRLQFERNFTAAWTFDSTNEPFTPMRGTFLKVSPFIHMADRTSFQGRPGGFIATADHLTAEGIEVVAERHWPMTEVSSISAGVIGEWATVDQRANPETPGRASTRRTTFEVLEGGYRRKIGRSFVDVSGRLVLRQPGGGDDARTSYEASTAWTRRSPRAALRIGFAYISGD